MATKAEAVPSSDISQSFPDDFIINRSRLSFSSSSIGQKDDSEFWSRTRKELIVQPNNSPPGRASSAPSLLIPRALVDLEPAETNEMKLMALDASLDDYRFKLLQGTVEQQAEVLLSLRKLLTDPNLCPDVSAKLFETDIVHLLLDTFAVHEDWKLQFNSLICLKEMSTCPTSHTPSLSIVRTMLELLDTSNIIEVIEVVLVILGHMTQDDQPIRTRNMRHLILNHNVLNRVTSILIDCNAEKLVPAVAWLASTLIEEPMPANVSNLLGDDFIFLLMRMTQSSDPDTQSNALCALCGVVESYKFSWELIVHDNPTLPSLLAIISHPSPRVALWGLKIFGNITSTDDELMMRALIDLELVGLLKPLISHPLATIRLWVAFALSNILTGMASHVNLLIEIDIVPPLVAMAEAEAHLQDEGDSKCESQVIVNAACALANALANTNSSQASTFIGQRALESVVRALSPTQPDYVLEAIISAIMHVLTEADPLEIISICGKLDKVTTTERLRSLANHPNKDLLDNANEIIRALNTIKFASTASSSSPPQSR